MNSHQEFHFRCQLDIYKAIDAIREKDYDAWMVMTDEELLNNVMIRTRGLSNPQRVRNIIEEAKS